MMSSRLESLGRTSELACLVGSMNYIPRLIYEKKFGQSNILQIMVDGIGPIFAQPRTDHLTIMSEVLGSGMYILPHEVFATIADDDIRVLDFGANIGVSALKIDHEIGLYDKKAQIVAVEPHPRSFGLLQMNCSVKNRYERIQPVGKAIHHQSGQRLHLSPLGKPSAYSVYHTSEGKAQDQAIEVETVSPQDLIENYFCGLPPHIVKIDIEGAEEQLFSGDTSWIANTPIVYIERHDFTLPHKPSFTPALTALEQYGFRQIKYYGNEADLLFVKQP